MKNLIKRIQGCSSIPQLMGYEGSAARAYFQTLGTLIVPEFAFDNRSKRPPLDRFNSMISLGYSILLNELVGKIEAKGLNPYFGIMHADREKHPTLASDLMEEWRAIIVDSTSMSLANGHEILPDYFYTEENNPGVYLNPDGFKIFIRKLDNKMRTSNTYITDVDYEMSFRRSMDHQINSFVKTLEYENPSLYNPIIIR